MIHVGGDHLRPVITRGLRQHLGAAGASGELRLEVRNIAVGVARRPFTRTEQVADFGLAEMTLVDHQLIVDQHAFLVDRAAVGRHRSGSDPTDVGMMASRGDKGGGVGAFLAVEHRNDHRDVGQMRTAAVGIVQHISVAALDPAPVPSLTARVDDRADALTHRTQVNRNVRRVGDQRAVAVEDRAGEIEPLLDVHAGRGRLQRDAHLLGDGHEQIVENLEPDRIDVGADRPGAIERHGAGEDQRAVTGALGPPPGLDDGGRRCVED